MRILFLSRPYSRPFVWDTSPKSNDRNSLGESRRGTRQHLTHSEQKLDYGEKQKYFEINRRKQEFKIVHKVYCGIKETRGFCISVK